MVIHDPLPWSNLLLEYSFTRSPNDIGHFDWDNVRVTFECAAQTLTSRIYAWCINYMKDDRRNGDFGHKALMSSVDNEAKLQCELLLSFHPDLKVFGGQLVKSQIEATLKAQNNGHFLEITYTVTFPAQNDASQANSQRWKYGIHIGASMLMTDLSSSESGSFWTDKWTLGPTSLFPGPSEQTPVSTSPSNMMGHPDTPTSSVTTQRTL